MQNSVNHRIVERTLRPGGSPSGHVRLRAVPFVARGRVEMGSESALTSRVSVVVRRPEGFVDASLLRTSSPLVGLPAFLFCGLRSSEIHPLNLSISISGGRETNRDSPSNGERSGNTPVPRSEISDRTDCAVGELWSGERSCPGVAFPGPEVDLERRAQEGESPVGPRNRERRDESWRSSSRVVWECSSNRVVDSIQG